MKNVLPFLILLMLLMGTSTALGQECGKGNWTISIYVPNGTIAKNLRYELFSVQPKNIERESSALNKYVIKAFDIRNFERCYGGDCSEAYKIDPLVAEKFLKAYDASAFQEVRPDLLTDSNSLKRKVKSGKISFRTWETFQMLLLLKISSDNFKPKYLLGNFLGGCYRRENLLLTESF